MQAVKKRINKPVLIDKICTYEQAVYERDWRIEKALLDNEIDGQ